VTDFYWCERGGHRIEGDPHTDVNGDDVCEEHCPFCRPLDTWTTNP